MKGYTCCYHVFVFLELSCATYCGQSSILSLFYEPRLSCPNCAFLGMQLGLHYCNCAAAWFPLGRFGMQREMDEWGKMGWDEGS